MSVQKVSELDLKPGDIILSRSGGFLSHAIRFFEKLRSGDARYSHALLAIGNGQVIESLVEVKINDLSKYDNQEIIVWRILGFSDEDRLRVARTALKEAGDNYGWGKIGLFALDSLSTPVVNLFRKNKRPVDFFTKKLSILPFQVCSQKVASWWLKGAGFNWGENINSIDPDYIDDYMLKTNQELIFEYKKTK